MFLEQSYKILKIYEICVHDFKCYTMKELAMKKMYRSVDACLFIFHFFGHINILLILHLTIKLQKNDRIQNMFLVQAFCLGESLCSITQGCVLTSAIEIRSVLLLLISCKYKFIS